MFFKNNLNEINKDKRHENLKKSKKKFQIESLVNQKIIKFKNGKVLKK